MARLKPPTMTKWRASVNLTPVLVGYELEPLSALVRGNETLQKEIDDKIAKARRTQTAEDVPACCHAFRHFFCAASDQGCGAGRYSIARLHQFLVGTTWASGRYDMGFLSRLVPGTRVQELARNKAHRFYGDQNHQRFDRRWGKSSSWGLFSASQEDGYASVGDLFSRTPTMRMGARSRLLRDCPIRP